VLVYAAVDQLLALGAILSDIAKRPFILVGFLAWLLLVPLAVTSTKRMVQRLGFTRWKLLHRAIYVIAALALVHFYWRVKQDATEPLLYAAVVGSLLLVRAGSALHSRLSRT